MAQEISQAGLSENAASGLAYVTIIPAIVFLIVEPFNRMPLVRFHSWQSIFLAIAWIAADVVTIILRQLPFIGWTMWFITPLIGLAFFILWLIVLINAFNGKRFKLRIVGDLAETIANISFQNPLRIRCGSQHYEALCHRIGAGPLLTKPVRVFVSGGFHNRVER